MALTRTADRPCSNRELCIASAAGAYSDVADVVCAYSLCIYYRAFEVSSVQTLTVNSSDRLFTADYISLLSGASNQSAYVLSTGHFPVPNCPVR